MRRYLKIKDNVRLKNYETGQAMSEGLLVIGIFFILIIGIQTTMSLQSSASGLLVESVKNLIQVHLGKKMIDNNQKNFFKLEDQSLFSDVTNTLFKEMSMAHPGLIMVRETSMSTHWGQGNITRQSFIDAGNGYASSDQSAQTNIEQSVSLWREGFRRSSASIEAIHSLASKTDMAWRRPAISNDLIQPWAGVVPDHALKRSQ